ncbi:MAG: hypothetical protein QNJ97_04705 [Myxococcota bacterium]|nr:hypothetical protein [Myxococcota bacterium]
MAVLTGAACSDRNSVAKSKPEGAPTVWESIVLGIEEGKFRTAAKAFAGIAADTDDQLITCTDQLRIVCLDVKKQEITERAASGHTLRNCVLQTLTLEKSSSLVDVRGEFLDGRLVRLTYRLTAGAYGSALKDLTNRFGQGSDVAFKERAFLEEGEVHSYRVWQVADVLWTLSRGEAETALLTAHDVSATRDLPMPAKPSQRGKPVSLEDLGIGKLDLNAKDPAIELPDAGL